VACQNLRSMEDNFEPPNHKNSSLEFVLVLCVCILCIMYILYIVGLLTPNLFKRKVKRRAQFVVTHYNFVWGPLACGYSTSSTTIKWYCVYVRSTRQLNGNNGSWTNTDDLALRCGWIPSVNAPPHSAKHSHMKTSGEKRAVGAERRIKAKQDDGVKLDKLEPCILFEDGHMCYASFPLWAHFHPEKHRKSTVDEESPTQIADRVMREGLDPDRDCLIDDVLQDIEEDPFLNLCLPSAPDLLLDQVRDVREHLLPVKLEPPPGLSLPPSPFPVVSSNDDTFSADLSNESGVVKTTDNMDWFRSKMMKLQQDRDLIRKRRAEFLTPSVPPLAPIEEESTEEDDVSEEKEDDEDSRSITSEPSTLTYSVSELVSVAETIFPDIDAFYEDPPPVCSPPHHFCDRLALLPQDEVVYARKRNTVGGYYSIRKTPTEKDPQEAYDYGEDGDGLPVDDDGDLRMETITLANREFRYFARLRNLPKVITDIFTDQSADNPFYFGKKFQLKLPISKLALSDLERTKSSTIYTELTGRQMCYQAATTDRGMPYLIAYATAMYFLPAWAAASAQMNSLHKSLTAYFAAQKVPLRIREDLRMNANIVAVRSGRVPEGCYHLTNVQGVMRDPHIDSGFWGDYDHPLLPANKRWICVKTSGGAKFRDGYIKFRHSFLKHTYNSVYCFFGVSTGVVHASSQEIEKILLRLTIDKTGMDEIRRVQSSKAYAHPDAYEWLWSFGMKPRFSSTDHGWAWDFLTLWRRLLTRPVTHVEHVEALTTYIQMTGIKVTERMENVQELTISPHIKEPSVMEVAFKSNEDAKIKVNPLTGKAEPTYARAFISMSRQLQWAEGKPYLVALFKSDMKKTFIWDKFGFYTDEGFIPIPNPHRPFMHTCCLYPITSDVVDVDKQHLATSFALTHEFVQRTGGFGSHSHGDDIHAIEEHARQIRYNSADIVANDITHAQGIFAALALLRKAHGTYNPYTFKQFMRRVRIRNPEFRNEYVDLEATEQMLMATGSNETTALNTTNSTVGCYGMARYGCEAAADAWGYTLEQQFTYVPERSTFLSCFFYRDTQTSIGWRCAKCPSTMLRKTMRTPGDFKVPTNWTKVIGKSISFRGWYHGNGVVKGLTHEPDHPIVDALREVFLTPTELAAQRLFRSDSPAQKRDTLIGLCNRSESTEAEVLELARKIRSIKYGTTIVDPVADRLFALRYGLPGVTA